MAEFKKLAPVIALGWLAGWLSAGRGEKSQEVRALDVLFIGPAIIYDAATGKVPPVVWAFLGAATISYNLRNYLANARSTVSS